MDIVCQRDKITLGNITFNINWKERKVNFEIYLGEIPEEKSTLSPFLPGGHGLMEICNEDPWPKLPVPVIASSGVENSPVVRKRRIGGTESEGFMELLKRQIIDYVRENQPVPLVYSAHSKSSPEKKAFFEKTKKALNYPPVDKLKEAVLFLAKEGRIKGERRLRSDLLRYSLVVGVVKVKDSMIDNFSRVENSGKCVKCHWPVREVEDVNLKIFGEGKKYFYYECLNCGQDYYPEKNEEEDGD